MSEFTRAYQNLNKQQRLAVDTIDGPLLVIAGPGTGKTQLLATRVANILKLTDTPPQSILCLTFTDSGAQVMRERLGKLIGDAAYDVQVSTYHAFGSDLIRRYPDETKQVGYQPIDELGRDATLREVMTGLDYRNPLRLADVYAKDLQAFISDAKRALLTPKDIEVLANKNLAFIAKGSRVVSKSLAKLDRISIKAVPLFENLALELQKVSSQSDDGELAHDLVQSLLVALAETSASGKSTSLTAWKNAWLAKKEAGEYILAGQESNLKLLAAAEIYRKYQRALNKQQLYDYDDMVLRAIHALETNEPFKLTLADQYLYILLDEFQDTNVSQLRLIELLSDNPVHEGRPNIMAVGDDDQAIYAFQGADHSNMMSFASMYRDVKVISLEENYRSTKALLQTAEGLSGQIEERLHLNFPGITKNLKAVSRPELKTSALERREFISDAAQYAWVSQEIQRLIKNGLPANEIAVLSPRHRYLEPLLPYLQAAGVPVQYERRENVLDDPLVGELEVMARLVSALQLKDFSLADSLWPVVLSQPFWGISNEVIWQLSWQAYHSHTSWTTLAFSSPKIRPIAEHFTALADLVSLTTAEEQLDLLMGTASKELCEELAVRPISQFYDHYFKLPKGSASTDRYVRLLSNLSALRYAFREYRRQSHAPLTITDFVQGIEAYRAAGLPILNSNPYHAPGEAVQLMTAYRAKGLEFGAVFVVAAEDEVWGRASRTQTNRLSLPINLQYIRYAGATEDERLRLLYVAMTRAKRRLYITSYTSTIDGKASQRLRYLKEQLDDNGRLHSQLLPPEAVISQESAKAAQLSPEMARYHWQQRHLPPLSGNLKTLLRPRLSNYQLSPSHLNAFTDVIYGGPQEFFLRNILRFPGAPTPEQQYGTVVHETLEWLHRRLVETKKLPSLKATTVFFANQLKARRLAPRAVQQLADRGEAIWQLFLPKAAKYIKSNYEHEVRFQREGSTLGPVRLTGVIDQLIIDKKSRTIEVVDFKTGKPHQRWSSDARLHKYRQQLLTYKLLVESSRTYAGYTVTTGRLIFLEPTGEKDITELEIVFEAKDVEQHKKLLHSVWKHIQKLDLPDIDKYPATLNGIKQFESDLVD